MSANDRDDFICQETDWIGMTLKEKKPFLGICLGAQMLANQLGAKVGLHAEELAEIGYYPLMTTAAGLELGGFPEHVYQWHREGFELAQGTRLLATSNGAYPNQAFAYGLAIGLQFHPEITCAQVNRWTGHNPTHLDIKGARARHEHLKGHLHHAPKVHAWLDRFLGRWAAAELTID
jgi:GMP synthase (glutamine-hydrolysing)